MQFSTNLVIQGSTMDQLLNEWLVELTAILDSLFHKAVNTTSSTIGVEGEDGKKP